MVVVGAPPQLHVTELVRKGLERILGDVDDPRVVIRNSGVSRRIRLGARAHPEGPPLLLERHRTPRLHERVTVVPEDGCVRPAGVGERPTGDDPALDLDGDGPQGAAGQGADVRGSDAASREEGEGRRSESTDP